MKDNLIGMFDDVFENKGIFVNFTNPKEILIMSAYNFALDALNIWKLNLTPCKVEKYAIKKFVDQLNKNTILKDILIFEIGNFLISAFPYSLSEFKLRYKKEKSIHNTINDLESELEEVLKRAKRIVNDLDSLRKHYPSELEVGSVYAWIVKIEKDIKKKLTRIEQGKMRIFLGHDYSNYFFRKNPTNTEKTVPKIEEAQVTVLLRNLFLVLNKKMKLSESTFILIVNSLLSVFGINEVSVASLKKRNQRINLSEVEKLFRKKYEDILKNPIYEKLENEKLAEIKSYFEE